MMSMIDDKPIEAVGFNWHKSDSHNGVYIGALQIILSNGQTSPVFFEKNHPQRVLQRVDLPSPVKTIRGTTNWNQCITQILFDDANSKQIAAINPGCKLQQAPNCVLNNGEVIIGIYGTCKNLAFFESIGFIVWTPCKYE